MDEEYTIQHQDGRVKIGMQPTTESVLRAKIADLTEERDLYLGALNRCASAAGNPDPSVGCRLVIYYVKEVTE